MRDSNRTKKILADAMIELMQEKSFEKISISDICDHCDMNRKSFYYHFLDKYDLVNWIFDTEFISVVQQMTNEDSLSLIKSTAELLYRNRKFYSKALQIQGQNSFSDHFRDMLYSVVSTRLEELMGIQEEHAFQKQFFTDAVVMAFYRWLVDGSELTPDEFTIELRKSLSIMKKEEF